LSEEELKAYKELGQIAKKWRDDCRLSQDKLAATIVRTKSSIINLENARKQKYTTIDSLVNAMLQCRELGIRPEDRERAKELLKQVEEELGRGETGRNRQIKDLIDDVRDLGVEIKDLAKFVKLRELVFTLAESDTEDERRAKIRLSDALENYRVIIGRPELKTFREAAARAITDFEAEMKELGSGTQKFRQHSRTRLDEAWESIIDEAKEPGDIVFATSVVPLEWWKENTAYLDRNRTAIARGVQLIRIFIMEKDDTETIALGKEETAKMLVPKKPWQELMAEQAKMGVQVNWLLHEELDEPAKDLLCARVSVRGDLHAIDNRNKRIIDMEVAGEQSLTKGRVQWSELTKSTNPRVISDIRDHIDEYYRNSVRFTYLDWYRDFYDESYLLIDNEGAKRETKAETELIRGLLGQVRQTASTRTSSLLDLGCGYGRLAKPLAEADKQITVLGIDASRVMIEEAKRRMPSSLLDRLLYEELDMINLEKFIKQRKMKESFNMVICMYSSFGYMSDQDNLKVLQTVATSLAPGGLFLLDTDDKDYFIRNQGGPKLYTKGTRGGAPWETLRYDSYDDKTKR
jgi:SAM-dependent methyltransferase/DNA-binding XRE family transcriptional regulator